MSQPLWSPRQLRFVRAVWVGTVGMLTFGLALVTAAYPSWQAALATVAMAAIVPIVWVGLGRRLTPFEPGTSAKAHLANAVYPLAAVMLFAVAAVLFSMAPGV